MLTNPRRTISDRRKIFIAVILLTVLTIAIVETVTVRATRNQLLDRTDSSLRGQLESARVAVNVLTPEALAGLIKVGSLLERESTITVVDARGKVIFELPVRVGGSAKASPVLPPRTQLRRRLGEPFDVRGKNGVGHFRAIAGDAGAGRTIVFATPLTAVNGTISGLTRDALLFGGLATLLLALLVWRLLAAATRPIDSMIDVASRIGGGDFTARVDPASLHGDAARLGGALNQMVTRIESAFAETSASEATLRRFVADASHELRTPLTSIRGYAQLVRMGAAGDEADKALRRIDSEAQRMAVLVDDLLLLARLDQGRPLERESVDVAALARELANDARALEPRRPIRLDLPDSALLVTGDEGRLRQLFTNLLGNVRRHTDAQDPCSVCAHATGSEVTITVADEGPGMAPADAAHAFDRFYRADASRSRDSGGSGLGLAIAKAIAVAHSGDIELTTEVGAGTTVQVHLPLAR